jgi:hypothetical protein
VSPRRHYGLKVPGSRSQVEANSCNQVLPRAPLLALALPMADPGASKLSDFNNVLPPHDHTCCGVVEHAAITVREKRSSRTTKQPWIVLKLMVFVTIGILGYTSYVYIGRLCLPIIRKRSGAPAGRGTGSECQTRFRGMGRVALWPG